MALGLANWKTRTMARAQRIEHPHWSWFVLLDGSLGVLSALVLAPSLAARVRRRGPLPSTRTLRAILVGALVVHLAEGGVAWRLARRDDLDAPRWALQTAIVGFPSLLLLRDRSAR